VTEPSHSHTYVPSPWSTSEGLTRDGPRIETVNALPPLEQARPSSSTAWMWKTVGCPRTWPRRPSPAATLLVSDAAFSMGPWSAGRPAGSIDGASVTHAVLVRPVSDRSGEVGFPELATRVNTVRGEAGDCGEDGALLEDGERL